VTWHLFAIEREKNRKVYETKDLGFKVIKLSTLFSYEMLIRA
jgi:hypothetical protein